VLNSNFFKFNGKIYRQTFGTLIGSPLFPVLADIVLQDIEKRAISRIPISIPFYFRYVDDILFAAPPSVHTNILDIFNSFHHRLQFTIETSRNNHINFLDVSIEVNEGILEFDWYTKPIFSGKFMNFLSQHPMSHKRGIVFGLLDRVFRLSHPKFLQKNLRRIIELLLNNDYPLDFIFSNIRYRLKFLIHSNGSKNPSLTDSCPSSSFFTMPYIKNITDKFSPWTRWANKSLAYVIPNKLNKIIKKTQGSHTYLQLQ